MKQMKKAIAIILTVAVMCGATAISCYASDKTEYFIGINFYNVMSSEGKDMSYAVIGLELADDASLSNECAGCHCTLRDSNGDVISDFEYTLVSDPELGDDIRRNYIFINEKIYNYADVAYATIVFPEGSFLQYSYETETDAGELSREYRYSAEASDFNGGRATFCNTWSRTINERDIIEAPIYVPQGSDCNYELKVAGDDYYDGVVTIDGFTIEANETGIVSVALYEDEEDVDWIYFEILRGEPRNFLEYLLYAFQDIAVGVVGFTMEATAFVVLINLILSSLAIVSPYALLMLVYSLLTGTDF